MDPEEIGKIEGYLLEQLLDLKHYSMQKNNHIASGIKKAIAYVDKILFRGNMNLKEQSGAG
ncbi:Uncharacterised protein [Helicobacter mustelae]|nr:Uncharacterised protein [Helicobacter mustelae]